MMPPRWCLAACAALTARAYLAPAAPVTRAAPLRAAGGLAVLQRKAKEAEQKKYVDALDAADPVKRALDSSHVAGRDRAGFGEVRERLKRNKGGTLGVVAEYNKRVPAALKTDAGGEYDIPDIALVSNELRSSGTQVLAMNMESVAGGCEDEDFAVAAVEQSSAQGDFPGPLPLVWMDAVVDEVQLARAAVAGADAVTLSLETLGPDRCKALFELAETKYGLEALVVCAPRAAGAEGLAPLLRSAVDDVGATLLVVGGVSPVESAKVPPLMADDDVVLVARVDAHDNQGLEEAEEAWDLRDAGYDAVWISEVLFKFGSFSGNLFASSPDTITSVIKAMRSKASTKFARASAAFSGKGEGAKEYLGDIMM